MTFMPLASVVDFTWSRPGTRAGAGGFAAALAAALVIINTQALSARRTEDFGMRHLDEECALYTARGKEKAPQTGEVVCGAEEANTGEELFAVLC
jgi:hypothetical protein